jgi:exonuclease III
MEIFKIALLGACEVRWNGAGSITINFNLFIYSGMPGGNEPHIRGVGILINRNIKDALLEWKTLSERIITARINTKFRKMSVVQCYAPISGKEAFYSRLHRTLLATHRSDILSMADFNVQVTNDYQDTEDVIGKYGTSFANKRRPLGRYSSLADYKPRSLVLV